MALTFLPVALFPRSAVDQTCQHPLAIKSHLKHATSARLVKFEVGLSSGAWFCHGYGHRRTSQLQHHASRLLLMHDDTVALLGMRPDSGTVGG
jgi:hypothetical protein